MHQVPERTTKISISNGTIIRTILFGLIVVALYYVRDILMVLLTSIVIASFIDRASKRLSRRGISRTLAVFIIYLVSFTLIGSIVYFFLPILILQLSNFASLISVYTPNSNLIPQNVVSSIKQISLTLSQNSFDGFATYGKSVLKGFSSGFFEVLTLTFGGIINLVLIAVMSFYLSIQEKGIEKFLRIITPEEHEEYVLNLWERSQRKIALWIQGQMLLGILVGVLIFLGLSLLGVQYAFLLAVLVAILELIPFGIFLAVIPAIMFAYAEGGITLMALTAGLYAIVQQFENYLIAPLIVKKVIGISPLVVIISVLVGAKLGGFWGLILAIPVAVPLLEFFDDIEKRKTINLQK